MKKLLFIGLLILFSYINATAAEVWIAQTASGSGDGSSFADRMSRSAFNGGANANIAAGTVIILTGQIEGYLQLKTSGTSGNHIYMDGHASSYNGASADGYFDFDFKNLSESIGAIDVTDLSYIDIRNIDMQGNNPNWTDVGYNHSSWGILIKRTAGSPGFVTVDNCTFTGTIGGVYVLGYGDGYSDVTITRSTFSNICGSATKAALVSATQAANKNENITIGGAQGYGNTFHNIGQHNPYFDLLVTGAMLIDHSTSTIISYNRVYCDDDVDYGMVTVQLNECQYSLIEYNVFDNNWHTDNHRTAISCKGDMRPTITEGPTIIRFNVFRRYYSDKGYYDGAVSAYYGSWGSLTGSITIGYDHVGAYVYGNSLSSANGISMNISSVENYGTNGLDNEDSYVFANVVSTTQTSALTYGGYSGAGRDSIINAWCFNNTIYKGATYDNTLGEGIAPFSSSTGSFAIKTGEAAVMSDGPIIKNNLIISPRPTKIDDAGVYDPEYRFIGLSDKTIALDIEEGYNHFYTFLNPAADRSVVRYFGSAGNYSKAANDATRKWYSGNDTVGNPYVFDADNDDFRLTANTPASVVSGGVDLGTGNIATVTIQGDDYTIPWGFALGKNTVFHETDPDSIVIDEKNWDTIGSWGKGAYAYEAIAPDTSVPTVQSATITSSGSATILTVVLNESCTGNTGFSVTPSGGASTLTYSSGTGITRIFTMSRAISYNETVTLQYSPGDVADASSNALAAIVSRAVSNLSTIDAPAGSSSGFSMNFVSNPTINFAIGSAPNWVPVRTTEVGGGYDEDSAYKLALLFEGDFLDSQGSANFSTPAGDAAPILSATTPLQGSQSVYFDYTDNEYVYINDTDLGADNPLKSGVGGAFTIYARIKSHYYDIGARFISKYQASSGKRGIEFVSGSGTSRVAVLRGYNSGDSFDGTTCVHGTALVADKVYYIGYAEGADASFRLRIWDADAGAALGSDDTGTYANGVYNSDAALSLGNRVGGTDGFSGRMDEFVIKTGADSAATMDLWFQRND